MCVYSFPDPTYFVTLLGIYMLKFYEKKTINKMYYTEFPVIHQCFFIKIKYAEIME